jgi:homoserine O-succinyltransferase/O-acetyltransferase
VSLLSRDGLLRRPASVGKTLAIGLVNNMPDAALKTTERQFRELLERAAGDMPFVLRVFSFPEMPRSADGQRYTAERHEPIENLWGSDLDGLIVTGAAPVASRVEDEPCWPSLTRLVGWAERHTKSTIWSCLAAHAAVWHIDGIERRPLGAKLSGVFDCDRVADHALLALAPPRWMTPHSRGNELPETELRRRGYRILSRSHTAGTDIFTKRCESLFVFLQGHPEYDSGALGREYRRDVVQFIAGRRDDYPELPVNYFPDDVAQAMRDFRQIAEHRPGDALFERFPALPAMRAPWHGAAVGLFAAWLVQLDAHRSRLFGWLPMLAPSGRSFSPTYA